jgi:hypothetical protein
MTLEDRLYAGQLLVEEKYGSRLREAQHQEDAEFKRAQQQAFVR